uniref:Sushi domain-containing protein n=1 Tax=Anas platyrhynchos TaxID=8839 RepID=A0A8B9T5N8_ANAPL
AGQVSGQRPACPARPLTPSPAFPPDVLNQGAVLLVFAELKEAFRNQSIFPVGRAVEYVCRPGYSAHPGMSATIVCLENQTWSAALEFCKGASCSARLGWKITLLGSEALWLYGFRCLGQPARTCEISGTRVSWSGAAPICQQVRCPSPPGIANGQHSGQPSDTFLVGSVVQYRCKDGYSLVENASLSCTAEGTWSRPLPRCEVVTCMSPSIQDGEVAEGQQAKYLPGATVTFRCHPGYTMQGSQEAKCHPDGRWVPAVPSCEPGEHGHGCCLAPWGPRGWAPPSSAPTESFGGDCTPRDTHGSKLAAGTHRVLALVALGISWWHCQSSCIPTGRWSRCSHI